MVDHQAYQYTMLSAGLSIPPWAWTKLIKVLKMHAHRLGIQLFQYIDDWIILAPSQSTTLEATQYIVKLAEALGFKIHLVKSQLTPLQDITYLGYRFLLKHGIVCPPEDRWIKVQKVLEQFLKRPSQKAHSWQILLGHLTALEKIVKLGMAHVRPIQLHLNAHWAQHSDSPFQVVPVT